MGFRSFSSIMKTVPVENVLVHTRDVAEYTILAKIYETNVTVSVKYCTKVKVQFQFLNSFLLVLTKFSFWEENWALGYNSMKI